MGEEVLKLACDALATLARTVYARLDPFRISLDVVSEMLQVGGQLCALRMSSKKTLPRTPPFL